MKDEIALSVVSVTDKGDTGAFAFYCLKTFNIYTIFMKSGFDNLSKLIISNTTNKTSFTA
jgi:hypothetical protein